MARKKEIYGVTKELIVDLLMRPDTLGMKAIGRALIAIRARQTYDEIRTEQTRHSNMRGFTQADAKRGTSMADFYAERGFLTAKQLAYWRKPNATGATRITKYWKQLQEDAIAKKRLKAAAEQMEMAA